MTLSTLLLGATAATCYIIALVFVRFLVKTRDRFFLLFAISFFIEGTSRIVLALHPLASEHEPLFYSVRLLAFLIIIYAIIDKNLVQRRFRKPPQPK